MEKNYEIGFVFFISVEDEDAVSRKDSLLDALDELGVRHSVYYHDIYNDGEDWNIECTADIRAKNGKNAEAKFETLINSIAQYETWDYHYIKGTDNNYYWQP